MVSSLPAAPPLREPDRAWLSRYPSAGIRRCAEAYSWPSRQVGSRSWRLGPKQTTIRPPVHTSLGTQRDPENILRPPTSVRHAGLGSIRHAERRLSVSSLGLMTQAKSHPQASQKAPGRVEIPGRRCPDGPPARNPSSPRQGMQHLFLLLGFEAALQGNGSDFGKDRGVEDAVASTREQR